jgi:hypothetical protein
MNRRVDEWMKSREAFVEVCMVCEKHIFKCHFDVSRHCSALYHLTTESWLWPQKLPILPRASSAAGQHDTCHTRVIPHSGRPNDKVEFEPLSCCDPDPDASSCAPDDFHLFTYTGPVHQPTAPHAPPDKNEGKKQSSPPLNDLSTNAG